MADQTTKNSQLGLPSQSAQPSNPMAGASIETNDVNPLEMQNVILLAVVGRPGSGPQVGVPAVIGLQAGPNPLQTGPNAQFNQGAPYQVVQSPSMPPSNPYITQIQQTQIPSTPRNDDYRPFASNSTNPSVSSPTLQRIAEPSSQPQTSPTVQATQQAATVQTATTQAAATTQATPTQANPIQSPVNQSQASTPAPTISPPTIQSTQSQSSPQLKDATQTNQAQANQALTTPAQPSQSLQNPLNDTLLAPTRPNLQSGSIANHIQNALATIINQSPTSESTSILNQQTQLVNSQPINQIPLTPQSTTATPPTPITTEARQSSEVQLNTPQLPASQQPRDLVTDPLVNNTRTPASALDQIQRETSAVRDVQIKLEPTQTSQLEQSHQRQQQTQHEQQRQQGVERLRDIQQIAAAERETIKPPAERESRANSSPNPERREQTTITIEKIRESILDRLTTIQNRVETAATERQHIERVRGPLDNRIQGRDNLIRPDPIHHDAKPSLITRLAERLHENQQALRGVREPIIGLVSTSAAERTRAQQPETGLKSADLHNSQRNQAPLRGAKDPERINTLVDIIKRFTERSINFKLLKNMDTSLEKACLTLVTGAALGYVGLEAAYRVTQLVGLQTLGFLREHSEELDQESTAAINSEERQLENELATELEEIPATELKTFGEQGFVVDLAGVVLNAESDLALENVKVECSEFGTCYTDPLGRFIFANIPLGTPYTISVTSSQHRLKPLVVTGVCGELEFLRIRVEVG
jgi:hypothetical protein